MPNSGEFDGAAFVGNTRLEHIYVNPFKDGKGKFFNYVVEDGGSATLDYSPPFPSRNRIKISVTFINADSKLERITLRKFKQYSTQGVSRWEEQFWSPSEPMALTHFSFEKLAEFLRILTEMDLVNFTSHRVPIDKLNVEKIDGSALEKIRELLSQPEGPAMVDELLRNGAINSRDLVNIGYRKSQLAVFKQLLTDPDALKSYAEKNAINPNLVEKVWQNFFDNNQWIFGFGLDYRFLAVLEREAHIGTGDVAGQDGPIGDFLLGATNFTVLVELKRPDTRLFESRQNRAGSWKLSAALIDSVSQLHEHKASWQLKSEARAASNFTSDGQLIVQKTLDPKCILIIGSNDQFSGTERDKAIKLRTFELFRRDSRNIEILTFDELFERATFVVGHSDSVLQQVQNEIEF
jgi:hypothetical protein